MRVLSVRQPWASLIASGKKPFEIRSWSTDYRGPVLIIVGTRAWKGEHGWPMNGPRGVSLCIVDLVDVRPSIAKDAVGACIAPPPDHFTWVFADPQPVTQVPVKGLLKLYNASPSLLVAVGVQ